MVAEAHRKVLVAEAALDFDASFVEIDDLAVGAICWCKPVTTLEDCDTARFSFALSGGDTTPAGDIQIFIGKKMGANLRAGEGFGNTLTDHGTEATAADVARMLQGLPSPIKVFTLDETANVTYTAIVDVPDPGPDIQLFIYNNTDEILNGTASPHSAYVEGWGPEGQ